MVLKRRPPPGIEADTRRRLADTLDVLGRAEEAAAEREQAGAVAMKNINDPMGLMAQGDLLTHQGRYDDACPFFDRALALTPSLPGGGRAHIMAKLALAHQQAGRSAESIRWTEASLANGPDKNIRRMMESIAGVGYADQGDLEKAEHHYRRALELAEAAGKHACSFLCCGYQEDYRMHLTLCTSLYAPHSMQSHCMHLTLCNPTVHNDMKLDN